MQAKSLTDRAADAFAGNPHENGGAAYLEGIYARWNELARTVRRDAALLLLAVVTFVLLEHAKSAEFNLGPLRLTNIASVLTLLPPIVSYLFWEALTFGVALGTYERIAATVTRALYPAIADNELESLRAPVDAHMFEGQTWRKVRESIPDGRIAKIPKAFESVADYGLIFGPFGFLVYAYVILFGDTRASREGVWISLAVVLFNLLRTLADFLDV